MAQRHPCEGFLVSPQGRLPTPCAHYTALLVLVYVACTIWLLQPPHPISPSYYYSSTPATHRGRFDHTGMQDSQA